MKWGVFALLLCLCGSNASKAQEQPTLLADAPRPQPGIIVGTVVDVHNDTIPGATVTLEGPVVRDSRTLVSNDNGFFEFKDLDPGTALPRDHQRPRICELDFTRDYAHTGPVRNRERHQAPSRDGADHRDCRLFRRRGRHRAGQDRGTAAHLRHHPQFLRVV